MAKIRLRTWRWLVLLLFGALFAAIIYRWISLERLQRFVPTEIFGTPTPEPTATRPPVITGKLDTAKLFNGITLHSAVETTPGGDAATERIQPESYVLDLKLLARVPSPNKTIEGLIGGFVIGTMGFWFAGLYQDWLSGADALIIGAAVAALAPVGDLFESMLKRDFGVKDAGGVIPAHGGALDRLDSLLFTAPLFFYAFRALTS